MAVNKKYKKNKKKKGKYNNKKKINNNVKNVTVVKEVNVNVLENKKKEKVSNNNLENDIKEKEINNNDVLIDVDDIKKIDKSGYKNSVLVFLLVFVSSLLVIVFPKIKLLGEGKIIISYNDNYVEPGYEASIYNKDITTYVYTDSNVLDGQIGEYEINYYVDLFGARLKKTRYVSVVDEDEPVVNVDSDTINVCPLQEVPDFEYNAVDEYDGDITSRVEKVIKDDRIILNVSDSSNNFTSKTVMINRGDNEKPVIKLKGNTVMFINYGNGYNEPGYEANDNCSNNLNDKVKVSGEVGRDIGTYTLTYSVSDENGNVASVTRKVIVGKKIVDQGVVNNGTIYLTFDDGPNEGTTNKILDILKEEGIKATFFVTCNGPDYLIKRMYNEGHTVALHTATHNYGYIYSSVDNYFNDLNRVSDRVKRITGVDSKIIRFPGGSSNTVSRNYNRGIMTELTNLVLNMGYHYFDWNVDAMDASTARSGSDVYYNVVSNLSINRSNVVLMHDTKNITVNGLRNIIKFGKENGYKFNKIDMDTRMVKHGVNN